MTNCPKCWSRDTGHSFVRGSSNCKKCGHEWDKDSRSSYTRKRWG